VKGVRWIPVAIAAVLVIVWVLVEWEGRDGARRRAAEDVLAAIEPALPPAPEPLAAEHERLHDAAQRAWSYVERQTADGTGFVRAVPDYDVGTIWDIASALAALHCARLLGLVEADGYADRMARALATLEALPLVDGAAFNKTYLMADGRPTDRAGAVAARGFGWSTLDIGRLLVWLRIIATHEQTHAPRIARIVARLDMERLVANGYLRGGEALASGRIRTFQEGRLGYEQYAARGFQLWGATADRALDWTENAQPRDVFGQPLLGDRRAHGCLTSEPFLLSGLELGWDPQAFRLALGVLAAQRARWRETGALTLVSEDASAAPPHYFYYYCVDLDGEPFAVTAQAQPILPDAPRAISTKAAFAWYALAPGEYTSLALDSVMRTLAADSTLPAGILESDGAPAGPENINTAAVVLEAAVYERTGRPLLHLRPRDLEALRARTLSSGAPEPSHP